MPTVELDIRQLADEGGTAPLAPITVTDAVLDEDGNTLADTLDEIKAGLKFVKIHSGVQNITAASQAVPLTDSPTNYDYLLVTIVANNTQKNVITHLKDDYGSNLRAYYFATPSYYGSFQCVVSGNSIVSNETPALSGYSSLGIGTVYGVKCSV